MVAARVQGQPVERLRPGAIFEGGERIEPRSGTVSGLGAAAQAARTATALRLAMRRIGLMAPRKIATRPRSIGTATAA